MSTPISQKQAVVDAVTKILGGSFTPESTNVKNLLTPEQLNEIRDTIFSGILDGDILFNKDTSDVKVLRRYINGMIDNHFRKAKELNGGTRYIPAHPGKGRRDPQLAALRKLIKQYPEDSDEFDKVEGAIEVREQELTEERKINAAARKRESIKDSIDISVLPEDLQDSLSQGD